MSVKWQRLIVHHSESGTTSPIMCGMSRSMTLGMRSGYLLAHVFGHLDLLLLKFTYVSQSKKGGLMLIDFGPINSI